MNARTPTHQSPYPRTRHHLRTEPSVRSVSSPTLLLEYLKGRYLYLRSHIETNKPAGEVEEHKQKLLSTINMIKTLYAKAQQIWQNNEIEQFHQDEFVERLCQLPLGKIIENLKREVSWQSQQCHPYFQVIREANDRQQLLQDVEQRVKLKDRTEKMGEAELTQICNMLGLLRMKTLLVLEGIMEWKKYMRKVSLKNSPDAPETQHDESTCRPFTISGRPYVERLHTDTTFLQRSVLSKYIYFGKESDPLMLIPYKTLINSEDSFMERYDCVVKLFNLNFDIAFRLNQAQKTLILETVSVTCPPIKRKKFQSSKQMEKDLFRNENSELQDYNTEVEDRKLKEAESRIRKDIREEDEDQTSRANDRQGKIKRMHSEKIDNVLNSYQSRDGNSSKRFKQLEERYVDQPIQRKRSNDLTQSETNEAFPEEKYRSRLKRHELIGSRRNQPKYQSQSYRRKVSNDLSPIKQPVQNRQADEYDVPVTYAKNHHRKDSQGDKYDQLGQSSEQREQRHSSRPKVNSRITLQPIESQAKRKINSSRNLPEHNLQSIEATLSYNGRLSPKRGFKNMSKPVIADQSYQKYEDSFQSQEPEPARKNHSNARLDSKPTRGNKGYQMDSRKYQRNRPQKEYDEQPSSNENDSTDRQEAEESRDNPDAVSEGSIPGRRKNDRHNRNDNGQRQQPDRNILGNSSSEYITSKGHKQSNQNGKYSNRDGGKKLASNNRTPSEEEVEQGSKGIRRGRESKGRRQKIQQESGESVRSPRQQKQPERVRRRNNDLQQDPRERKEDNPRRRQNDEEEDRSRSSKRKNQRELVRNMEKADPIESKSLKKTKDDEEVRQRRDYQDNSRPSRLRKANGQGRESEANEKKRYLPAAQPQNSSEQDESGDEGIGKGPHQQRQRYSEKSQQLTPKGLKPSPIVNPISKISKGNRAVEVDKQTQLSKAPLRSNKSEQESSNMPSKGRSNLPKGDDLNNEERMVKGGRDKHDRLNNRSARDSQEDTNPKKGGINNIQGEQEDETAKKQYVPSVQSRNIFSQKDDEGLEQGPHQLKQKNEGKYRIPPSKVDGDNDGSIKKRGIGQVDTLPNNRSTRDNDSHPKANRAAKDSGNGQERQLNQNEKKPKSPAAQPQQSSNNENSEEDKQQPAPKDKRNMNPSSRGQQQSTTPASKYKKPAEGNREIQQPKIQQQPPKNSNKAGKDQEEAQEGKKQAPQPQRNQTKQTPTNELKSGNKPRVENLKSEGTNSQDNPSSVVINPTKPKIENNVDQQLQRQTSKIGAGKAEGPDKSPLKSPKKLEIRIKEPKIPTKDFNQYLQQFINSAYFNVVCQSQKVIEMLPASHFNIVEVHINETPTAVAICAKNRRNGNIRIKYFLFKEDNFINDILRVCSNFIFNKDPCDELNLQIYEQKDTEEYAKVLKTLSNVGYYLVNSTFLPKSKRTLQCFALKRTRPFDMQKLFDYYSQGLSIKCSLLTLKSTNQKEFESDEIEKFEPTNFNSNYLSQSLLKSVPNSSDLLQSWRNAPTNKSVFDNFDLFTDCPADLQSRTKIQKTLSIKATNQLLEKESMDTYETSRQIEGISLVRYSMELPLDFMFIIDNGYLIFTLQDQFGRFFQFGQSKLLLLNTKVDKCYLALLKNDTKKLEARSLEVVLKDNTKAILSGQGKTPQPKIGVHFLDKQLYGKVQDIDAQNRIYGNMQMSIVYRDYLEGTLVHGINPKQYILFDEMTVTGMVYQHKGRLLPVVQTLIDKADLLFF